MSTRRAVVVVGSHRSGTSALARILSLVGCDLPKHLIDPHEDNELGFWEPQTIVEAHDAFLKNVGSSWDDVASLPDGAFVSAAAWELRQQLALLLREEYGESRLFVVKDPRISRLVPLWLAVLAELQITPAFALAVRNPLEVAASLKARDGFTTTKSLLLWLRHTIESEQYSRGRPRSFVLYDELLQNWQGVVARVEEDLGVTWPGRSHRATVEIERFLSDRQRHHVFDWRDIEGRPDVVSWVKEAYFALRASDPVQVLDQVRDELARADIAFGPILEEARLERDASQERILEGVAARDALGQDLEASNLELEARGAELKQLQEELAQVNSALGASTTQAATREAEVAALQADRDRLAYEIERFSALGRDLEARNLELEAREAELQQLQEQLAQVNSALRASATQAATREAELAALQADRDRLAYEIKRFSALGQDLEARNLELEARETELHRLQGELGRLNSALAASASQAAAREAEVARLHADRDRLAHEIERFRDDAERLAFAVEAAQARVDAATAETARTRDELRTAYTEVEQVKTAASEAVAQATALEATSRAERNNLLTALDAAWKTVEQLEKRAAGANDSLSALRARAASDREELLQELAEARADTEQLTARILAAESKAEVERRQMLADLDVANDEVNRLAKVLEDAWLDADALSATADELLLSTEADLEASRAERDRLQAEVVDARDEQSRLLTLVAQLEATLTSTAAGLGEQQQTATAAVLESAAQRAEFHAELARLMKERETARTDLDTARSEIELVRNKLDVLESEAARERAALSSEHDAARTGQDRLASELELVRTHAEELAAHSAELETTLGAHTALLRVLQSVTKRRTSRGRSLSQLGSWLVPPTPTKLNYLRRYVALRRSGEFDVDSYLLSNPDVLAAGIDPLMHYAEHGVVEGRTLRAPVSPSAGSATAERRELQPAEEDQNEALQPSGEDQLDHDVDVILASDLFSPGQYQEQFTQAEIPTPAEHPADLARHYLLHGERAGLAPSVLFDPGWYAAEYPDVLGHRSLLLHFIEFGDLEHRSPHPLFEPAFYAGQVAGPIDRPYAHFRARPDETSCAPHPMLDLLRFLNYRRWDAQAARDPFAAFLKRVTDDAFLAHVFQGEHYALELGEPYDPERHNVVCYLARIRTENVSAHPTFDAESYLRANPDVRAAGRHAYLHYLLQGREEGRWNGGSSQPTNVALAVAQGERAELLDGDDTVTVDSVELVTKTAVLFLSGCPGDAKRYRADHQAEQASMLGMTCDALVVGEIPFDSILERYRCVILHRVAWDASVERVLTDAKLAGIPVLFDTDDLVFDPDAIGHVAALEEMDEDERRLYLSGLHRYRRTLANTDGVIVSTDRLAEEARVVNSVVDLAYNAVSAEMADLADEARSAASQRASSVTIAYLSGTPTHNRDFAEAADALLRILETQPQVRFVAVGHIDLDERFDRFAGQLDRVPLQPWRSLPSILAGVDINLAPLERDNPFTDSKSCLKYIEAGLVGVPTIASPRRDFVRAIRHGVNGLLADSPDEWHSALERLVANPGERASIGSRAAADVREHHTTAARARAFHSTVGRLARAAPRDAPLAVDWVVRAPLPRTGGYRTIFRLASFLAQRGHQRGCTSSRSRTWKGCHSGTSRRSSKSTSASCHSRLSQATRLGRPTSPSQQTGQPRNPWRAILRRSSRRTWCRTSSPSSTSKVILCGTWRTRATTCPCATSVTASVSQPACGRRRKSPPTRSASRSNLSSGFSDPQPSARDSAGALFREARPAAARIRSWSRGAPAALRR